jgi:hypothetical protein
MEQWMNQSLRIVILEGQKGFASLVQTILESEPGSPSVVGIFRNGKFDPKRLAALAPDVLIVEADSCHPLDWRWRSALPQGCHIPVLVCTPCILLTPPSRDNVGMLVMPFTVDELFSALAQLAESTATVVHPIGW